eukprot:453063_1
MADGAFTNGLVKILASLQQSPIVASLRTYGEQNVQEVVLWSRIYQLALTEYTKAYQELIENEQLTKQIMEANKAKEEVSKKQALEIFASLTEIVESPAKDDDAFIALRAMFANKPTPANSPKKAPTPTVRVVSNAPTKAQVNLATSPPTKVPTKAPAKAVKAQTKAPTKVPTKAPTKAQTVTTSLTKSPTKVPTKSPTKSPTDSPTKAPTDSPTKSPTKAPTKAIVTPTPGCISTSTTKELDVVFYLDNIKNNHLQCFSEAKPKWDKQLDWIRTLFFDSNNNLLFPETSLRFGIHNRGGNDAIKMWENVDLDPRARVDLVYSDGPEYPGEAYKSGHVIRTDFGNRVWRPNAMRWIVFVAEGGSYENNGWLKCSDYQSAITQYKADNIHIAVVILNEKEDTTSYAYQQFHCAATEKG